MNVSDSTVSRPRSPMPPPGFRFVDAGLVVLLSLMMVGCEGLFADIDELSPPDVDAGFGLDTDGSGDNPCGGEHPLQYQGDPAMPGGECGDCGVGTLACDGANDLECVGTISENACGGCASLDGGPGESCGPCDDGEWRCHEAGFVECQDASEPNVCGGCAGLEGFPGEACHRDDGTSGLYSCSGPDELRCIAPGENRCGGDTELEGTPGEPCGDCNLGVVVCEGPESVTCHNEDEGVNDCGGCSPLEGPPGESCGICDGKFECASDDHVVCEQQLNECGGCDELEGTPGEDCEEGGIWSCDGPDELTCLDDATNSCGGDDELDVQPGRLCGDCDDGVTVCTSPDSVACTGASELNECGGCAELPGQDGESCGAGATWECTDEGTMRCESEEEDDDDPTIPSPVEGVTATEGTFEPYVHISWEAADGADEYRIYRDGVEISSSPVTVSTSVDDLGAASSPPPAEPPNAMIDEETTDYIRIIWDSPEVPVGEGHNAHDYEVVAVNAAGAGQPDGDTGWRRHRDVDSYQIRSSLDAATWEDWRGVTSSAQNFDEDEAHRGTIEHDDHATAIDAAHLDHIVVETSEGKPKDGPETHYQIRAINATGAGEEAGDLSGRRRVGDIDYRWERRQPGGSFSPVEACEPDSPTCVDTDDELEAGVWYDYQVVLSADGADDVTVDAGQARRAMLGEVETDEVPDDQISEEEAGVSASIVEAGAPLPDEHGFCYDSGDTSPDHDDNIACFDFGNIADDSVEAFETTLTDLDPITTYSVRAFVHTDADGIDDGYSYGDPVVFTTESACPADEFDGGDGSPGQPFEVATANQLNAIGDGDECRTDHFELVDDIDMDELDDDYNIIGHSEDWSAEHEHFHGHLDGNGHTISNFTLERGGEEAVGLFGYLREDAKVTDLEFAGVDVRGRDYVGALAGRSFGTIENCSVSGTVEAGWRFAGGLVGSNSGEIRHSSASGVVSGVYIQVGGLVGRNSPSGAIVDSTATAEVASTGSRASHYVGGLVGSNSGLVEGSSATGDVHNSLDEEDEGDLGIAGGLAGRGGGTFRDSYATGDVDVSGGGRVGGLLGDSMGGEIIRSYATGDVTGTDRRIGGLVGRIRDDGIIRDCYALGDVDGGEAVGGLVGELVESSDEVPEVHRSYSVGTPTGDGDVGGLIGRNADDSDVVNSYWDEVTGEMSTSDGGSPLATDDFDDESNFDDWDFDDVWIVDTTPEPDEQFRPILRWQTE